MKNIHVLPTEKPSRLVKFFTNKFHLCKEILPIQDEEQYQNIYITNDEEIKEGDWVFNFEYNYIVQYNSEKHDNKFWYKKIILTTDQDLIKDGVQAIDDTFLEWFVKNPSCESVETDLVPVNYFGSETIVNSYGFYKFIYKITIPQEEPIRKIDSCYNFDIEIGCVQDICRCEQEKPKQETLEETLNSEIKLVHDVVRNKDFDLGFQTGGIFGAKWQAKKSYNEAIEFAEWIRIKDFQTTSKNNWIGLDMKYYTTQELFEEFKKK